MHPSVARHLESIEALCRLHGIRRLAFFGSVLRDDFEPGRSDVDVLIELTPEADARATLFTLARIKSDLEDLIGCRVDLSLRESLHPRLRQTILDHAEVCYDAA